MLVSWSRYLHLSSHHALISKILIHHYSINYLSFRNSLMRNFIFRWAKEEIISYFILKNCYYLAFLTSEILWRVIVLWHLGLQFWICVLVRLPGCVPVTARIPCRSQWFNSEDWLSRRQEKIHFHWWTNGMIAWRVFLFPSQRGLGGS